VGRKKSQIFPGKFQKNLDFSKEISEIFQKNLLFSPKKVYNLFLVIYSKNLRLATKIYHLQLHNG